SVSQIVYSHTDILAKPRYEQLYNTPREIIENSRKVLLLGNKTFSTSCPGAKTPGIFCEKGKGEFFRITGKEAHFDYVIILRNQL
ncbi:MAG: hypothetical protein UGE23_02345, partial [Peptococcaceae bacterium]|nr:hypothetical protein [Peptococcaceae bacterium]